MKVGDTVRIGELGGACVFCETVIYLPGMAGMCLKKVTLEHIKSCPDHPLRGFNPRKYKDDARGPDEGESKYRAGPRP